MAMGSGGGQVTDFDYGCPRWIPCGEHGRHDVLCDRLRGHKGDHHPHECGPWTYHWRQDPLLKEEAERWEQEVAIPAPPVGLDFGDDWELDA